MSEKDNWRAGRRVICNNAIHLVFATRRKGKVLSGFLLKVIEETIKETCDQMGCDFVEFSGGDDYVSMIVMVHSKYSVSNFVGKLKGKTAYVLRRDHLKKIEHIVWGVHFWSPSYLAVSALPSYDPAKVIADYIETLK